MHVNNGFIIFVSVIGAGCIAPSKLNPLTHDFEAFDFF